jgi:hypothetical protein
MEPGEALSAAAQVAATLAGFAGVVVVFRKESAHASKAIHKLRLASGSWANKAKARDATVLIGTRDQIWGK